jgi:hypothetical protein
VVSEIVMVFAPPAIQAIPLTRLRDEMAQMTCVALCCEVGMIETSVVVGNQVREVLPNEAQVGRTGARLEEQRVGGEEAGVYFGGEAGHAVDRLRAVGDSREKRRAENPRGKASLT